MKKKMRVLITTSPKEVLVHHNGLKNNVVDRTDIYQSWTQTLKKRNQIRIGCPPVGLRFLKENVPGIDILEYPGWKEYEEALTNGYDIVGISYFTCSMHVVPRMVEMARDSGAKEVWAGNHGVFTPGTRELFDRVIVGSGEKVLYEYLEGKPLRSIKHPPIISEINVRSFSSKVGYLYTKRGCNMGCIFCSTPQFLPYEIPISMDEIKKVLDVYRQENVISVVIYDETFMTDVKFSMEVIKELAKRELHWTCLTRPDRIKGRIQQMVDLYGFAAIIGIESFREVNLQTMKKREKAKDIERTIEEMNRQNLRIIGTFMLGHPEDTAEDIYKDIERLSSLGLFLAQITLVTPLPGTPLWEQLEHRIIDKDWNHYDTYSLVWKHPYIKPSEARDLIVYAQRKINIPSNYINKLRISPNKKKLF